MDNRRPAPIPMNSQVHRTPSPGHPLQHGYHLEDNPYGRSQQGLDIPPGPAGRYSPGDSLQMQTAVSAHLLGSITPTAHTNIRVSNPSTTCRNTPHPPLVGNTA